jgi:hypothetical protein
LVIREPRTSIRFSGFIISLLGCIRGKPRTPIGFSGFIISRLGCICGKARAPIRFSGFIISLLGCIGGKARAPVGFSGFIISLLWCIGGKARAPVGFSGFIISLLWCIGGKARTPVRFWFVVVVRDPIEPPSVLAWGRRAAGRTGNPIELTSLVVRNRSWCWWSFAARRLLSTTVRRSLANRCASRRDVGCISRIGCISQIGCISRIGCIYSSSGRLLFAAFRGSLANGCASRRQFRYIIRNFTRTYNFNGLIEEFAHFRIESRRKILQIKRNVPKIQLAAVGLFVSLQRKQRLFIGTSVATNNASPSRHNGSIRHCFHFFKGNFTENTLEGSIATSRQFVVGVDEENLHGSLLLLNFFFREGAESKGDLSLLGFGTPHVVVTTLVRGQMNLLILVHHKMHDHRGDESHDKNNNQHHQDRATGATRLLRRLAVIVVLGTRGVIGRLGFASFVAHLRMNCLLSFFDAKWMSLSFKWS